MSRFVTPLVVTLLDDAANEGRGEWRLFEPFAYVSDKIGVVSVPAGFQTDFASVPRAPVMFWLAADSAHQAAVIHDYLYATASVSRADADDVLLEAMEAEGVPAWRRWGMYLAVRAFGGSHYGYAAD
ncbi:MAG: DUF1353 domain-containing protein [Propionivibrio sp.]|uniref:DUF1353 domain-containing protein n=1 Tax=Propionivibrio sp. TaxID=2212460 RepID=UPI0025FEBD4C|nr:DUF1353 domain-containing protein [Propionivibrio sp.]MBK8893737.1 DUF1353 domain-containing protein [Propionivibrio sp.]